MDPKWDAMGSCAPDAESENSVAVYWNICGYSFDTMKILTHAFVSCRPTTPRRAAGMLDFEHPSPYLASKIEQNENDVIMEGSIPTTPSLLSRLFSWGTPVRIQFYFYLVHYMSTIYLYNLPCTLGNKL